MEMHKEMDKVSNEYQKFETQLSNFYNTSEPKVAISRADSLILVFKIEKDPIRSKIKDEAIRALHYLKAEKFYILDDYKNSIDELNQAKYLFIMGDLAAGLAANKIKLKQYEEAQALVDSVKKGYYIYDYCLANYYECIRDKTAALKIYSSIKNNKNIRHYAHYPWSVKRFEELQKENPKLLNEIYFPTRNPNFEIAESDDYNRSKIFEIIGKIQEVRKCKNCNSTWIYESPQTNDKDYYWIKVGENNGYLEETFKTKFDFFVYPKNFEIRYYDEKNKRVMTLDEWRKLNQNGL